MESLKNISTGIFKWK